MKTFRTRLSSSLVLLVLSAGAAAKPVAQVVEVSGNVFAVGADGKTIQVRANHQLEDRSEVMVEEGASVTLNDYYNATYYLAGGSLLKFFNKSVQLKRGKTWIQSLNTRAPLALTTANGHVDFSKGEFITTFDQASSRSQVLVVTGEVEVSNILNRDLKTTVQAGAFTMVDPEIENGTPRAPTRVGLQSLNAALGEFKKLPRKMLEAALPARAIASVQEDAAKPQETLKKGEIIFIQSTRLPASVKPGDAHSYFKKVAGAKKLRVTPVPIKIYGTAWKKTEAAVRPRTPASIQVTPPSVQKTVPAAAQMDNEFGDSLKKQETEQPKYSKELQSLIDELKSY
jgi:hypothetical protein